MRVLDKILHLVCCALLFVACDNGEDNDLPTKPTESKCYKGTMVVDQNDGTYYRQSDVEVDYELRDNGRLNFVMYKVKFASGMPLKLDMVVEGANYTVDGDTFTLSGDGLVPYAMGSSFDKFTITQLKGTISQNTTSLTFICGEYPVTYEGAR